jgi:sugar fermentation stimulation protein A
VVRPADEIDALYGQTLREAAEAGVELLAYACQLSPEAVTLERRVPIDLS